MRWSILLMVVIAGCATDAEAPEPIEIDRMDDEPAHVAATDESGADVCALAAALPEDDICSKVCDPDAMAAQLAADGNETGFCYQLYCQLSETAHVLVGVCLAP